MLAQNINVMNYFDVGVYCDVTPLHHFISHRCHSAVYRSQGLKKNNKNRKKNEIATIVSVTNELPLLVN